MSRHRSINRLLITVTIMVLALGRLSSTAHGADAGFTSVRVTPIVGNADFVDGFHFNGIPGFGKISWDYTPINGVVVVTARVQGTLYLDKLGAGCARLKINFQDRDFHNIFSPPPLQFCGPGFDANNPTNQRAVDVSSFPDQRLRHVQLVVGSGSTIGSIIDEGAYPDSAVSVNVSDIINNGTADFGNLFHAGGTPLNPALISLRLRDDGRIGGNVSGMLFWDSFSAGCARLIINFRDINDANLSTRTIDECGPNFGNALLSSNQTAVNQSFNDARLFKIRLRVGTVDSSGNFVGTVKTRTYSFGTAVVGIVVGIPANAFTQVGDDTTYGVDWMVPDPANWRSLDIMDVRLIDDQGEILQVRWDEATNTFSQFKPRTGKFSTPALPGSPTKFQSSAVTMFLENSEVIDSGPTGPWVLLNLNLQFKQQAAGRTFTVEVLARDDSGGVQGWDVAGTITVLPRDGSDDGDE